MENYLDINYYVCALFFMFVHNLVYFFHMAFMFDPTCQLVTVGGLVFIIPYSFDINLVTTKLFPMSQVVSVTIYSIGLHVTGCSSD